MTETRTAQTLLIGTKYVLYCRVANADWYLNVLGSVFAVPSNLCIGQSSHNFRLAKVFEPNKYWLIADDAPTLCVGRYQGDPHLGDAVVLSTAGAPNMTWEIEGPDADMQYKCKVPRSPNYFINVGPPGSPNHYALKTEPENDSTVKWKFLSA